MPGNFREYKGGDAELGSIDDDIDDVPLIALTRPHLTHVGKQQAPQKHREALGIAGVAT